METEYKEEDGCPHCGGQHEPKELCVDCGVAVACHEPGKACCCGCVVNGSDKHMERKAV